MANTREIDDLVEKLSAKALREHADEFAEISTQVGMREHIFATLHDSETKGFCRESGAEVYYNEKSNTLVILDSSNKTDGGTCYRWNLKGTSFDKHVLEEHENENNAPAVHKSNAFENLHPDYVRAESQSQDSEHSKRFDPQTCREAASASALEEANQLRSGDDEERSRRR